MIGYFGLGAMGSALAKRLLLKGPLLGFDPDPAARRRLAELGVDVAENLLNIGTCEIFFLCLPTSQVVEKVLFGAEGLASVLRPGSIVIDQTSGDPRETRRMAELLRAKGIELVDAPVSGGPQGVEAGTTSIIVGASEAMFARLEETLRGISGKVFHAGNTGCGNIAKLANNLLSASQRLVTMEAFAMAQKSGVSPEVLCDIVLAGSGRNFYLESFFKPQVLQGRLRQGAPLAMMAKDVALALQAGDRAEMEMPFAALTAALFEAAIAEHGGAADLGRLLLFNDARSGASLAPAGHDLGAEP